MVEETKKPKPAKEPVYCVRGYFPKSGEAECLSESKSKDPDVFREGPVREGSKCLAGQTYLMDSEVAKKLANKRIIAFGEDRPDWMEAG